MIAVSSCSRVPWARTV